MLHRTKAGGFQIVRNIVERKMAALDQAEEAFSGGWTNIHQLIDGRWVGDIWRYPTEEIAAREADDDLDGEDSDTLSMLEGHFQIGAFSGVHMQIPTTRDDLHVHKGA